jgi:hypothetical protein
MLDIEIYIDDILRLSKYLTGVWAMFSFLALAAAAAQVASPALPVVVIDTRYTACSFEEKPYYFAGKADRRALKVQAQLDAQGQAYSVVRWEKDADVPDAAVISAMGPKKYLRNC